MRRELLRLVAHLTLDEGIAVVRLDDAVGDAFRLILYFRVLATNQALGGENRVLGIGNRLAFRGLSHQSLACLSKGDDGWRRASALSIWNDDRLIAVHHCHA